MAGIFRTKYIAYMCKTLNVTKDDFINANNSFLSGLNGKGVSDGPVIKKQVLPKSQINKNHVKPVAKKDKAPNTTIKGVTPCDFVGPRNGKKCTKIATEDLSAEGKTNHYCKAHYNSEKKKLDKKASMETKKKVTKGKKNGDPDKKAKNLIKTYAVKSKEKLIIETVKLGDSDIYVDKGTGFVLDKETKQIYGKLGEGGETVNPLSDEDKRHICTNFGEKYISDGPNVKDLKNFIKDKIEEKSDSSEKEGSQKNLGFEV